MQKNPELTLRQGTFLFCDLVGSTRMVKALEPEEQVVTMRALRDAVLGVIEVRGGRVERFDGDGYFVSFVGLDTHEGDAVVAVRVGLEIAAAVEAAGARVGYPMQMRVGVASGPVVVGLRETHAVMPDEGYIGEAVNLAKRLASVAPVGGVLISASTRRLTGRFFDYEARSALALAGFEEGVQAWTVTRASEVASRFLARHASTEPPWVFGRDAETQQLQADWERSKTGHGCGVLLRGEPGIGKSSLAHRVRAGAENDGAIVLQLDCTPRTQHAPFYPLAVTLRRLAGVPDRAAAQQVVGAVRDWIARTWGEAHARALDPFLPLLLLFGADLGTRADQTAQRAITALCAWLRGWTERAPVLVLAQDLQWADDATLGLLTELSAALAGVPMLLLATTRTDRAVPAALQTRALELAALDEASARLMVQAMLKEADPGAEVVPRIVQVAEGIPLYLEELAQEFVASPGLDAVLQGSRALPETLATLIQSRLDRLPELRPIVRTAAVVGRVFSPQLVEQLVDSGPAIVEAASRLVNQGLWDRNSESGEPLSLRFRHALIQDAVYHSMLANERAEIHSRVADVLRDQFSGDPAGAPEVVGHHLAMAGRSLDAARCYLQASQSAAARSLFADAVVHGREGLTLAHKAPESTVARNVRRQLYAALGVAAAATSGYAADEVNDAYDQAERLCGNDDDPLALFPIVRGRGTFDFVRGRFAQAHAIALQCAQLARAAGRVDFEIEAESFLGYTHLYRGEVGAAHQVLARCVQHYRAQRGERFVYPSPQDAGVSALSLLGTAAWLRGHCHEAERSVVQLRWHARKLRRPIDKAYALVWAAMQRNLQRRFGQAQQLAQACIAISQAHGFNTWLGAATMQHCIAVVSQAAAPQAMALLDYALQEFKRAGAEANETFFLWGLARGARMAGDEAGARRRLEQAHDSATAHGEEYMRAELFILQAELEPDTARAAELLQRAFSVAEAQGAHMVALRAACTQLRREGDRLPARFEALAPAARVLATGGAGGDAPPDGWAAAAVEQARQVWR